MTASSSSRGLLRESGVSEKLKALTMTPPSRFHAPSKLITALPQIVAVVEQLEYILNDPLHSQKAPARAALAALDEALS